MIFEETDRRTGRKYIVGSKYWPDGTRFRRRFSNRTLAKSVLSRIESAIAMGTWKALRKELDGEKEVDYTICEFADIYFEEYCKVRNTRPDFKKERLKIIKTSSETSNCETLRALMQRTSRRNAPKDLIQERGSRLRRRRLIEDWLY